MKLFSVLFVCMGNLCRSPSAHGVFRQRAAHAGLASQVRIDSAGTHAAKGERADARAVVVTADILLADRCLKAGALVIGNNGKPFTLD